MITIDKELQQLIPPLTKDERDSLVESLLNEGCRDPLILWGDVIIDGHNRYEICTKYNIPYETRQKEFATRDDVKLWMIRNQLARRNINNYARITLENMSDEIISKRLEAKANLSANGGDRTKAPFQNSEKAVSKVNTAKEIAKRANASTDTVSRVIKINKAIDKAVNEKSTVVGQQPEELKEKLINGDVSVNEIYTAIKRKEKEDKREAQRQENAEKVERLESPLEAQGLFQTIVIDPPWDWGDEGDVDQFGRAKPDYHTMPIEEISALPVNEIADENCHLYLWVTNRSLPKAFKLINDWGFRYITCLTWVKPSFGMGNYFRGSTEQVLFAVKGSQPLKRKDVGTHFEAPRGDKHSSKPEEFYRLVESCSYAPYIDIFGRKDRSGWSVWGENG